MRMLISILLIREYSVFGQERDIVYARIWLLSHQVVYLDSSIRGAAYMRGWTFKSVLRQVDHCNRILWWRVCVCAFRNIWCLPAYRIIFRTYQMFGLRGIFLQFIDYDWDYPCNEGSSCLSPILKPHWQEFTQYCLLWKSKQLQNVLNKIWISCLWYGLH